MHRRFTISRALPLAILAVIGLQWVGGCGEDSSAAVPDPTAPPSAALASSRPAPASRPAASRPSTTQPATVPPWQPLADAVVGEWVEYAGLGGITLRYEVVKVRVITVTTRVTVRLNGKLLGMPALREDRRDADPLAIQARRARAERQASPAEIEAAGRTLHATRDTDRWTSEEVPYVRQTWVSPQVPVFGTVRMELRGDGKLEARLELVGMGRPGAATRPAGG